MTSDSGTAVASVNYEPLFDELRGRQVRIALTGANGGFGRTFLAPCRDAANVALAVLCDRDLDGLRATPSDLGFPAAGVVTCTTEADVRSAAGAGRIALVADSAWLALVPHDGAMKNAFELACRMGEKARRGAGT